MGKKKSKLLSAGAIRSEGFNVINEKEREDQSCKFSNLSC